MYIIGIWIKSSVTSAIYRKSLTISSAGKKETTTGEVVNLMSVDTQRVVDMMVSAVRFCSKSLFETFVRKDCPKSLFEKFSIKNA
jgi:hypothetical protein